MQRGFAFLAIVVLAAWAVHASSRAGEQTKPEYSVKDVMQKAHKGGILKKVTDGQGTSEDKASLLRMYIALWENAPPQGDMNSWREKTGNLVVGAARLVLDEDGAAEKLKAAANCDACHKAHKGK